MRMELLNASRWHDVVAGLIKLIISSDVTIRDNVTLNITQISTVFLKTKANYFFNPKVPFPGKG